MTSPTTSFRPQPGRRPSISSRLSFAISHAESGEDVSAAVPAQAQIAEEIAEIKRYEDFTTIDWVQDAAREQARRKSKQRRAAGLYGQGQTNWRHRVSQSYDAAQGWIVVTIIGAAIGLNAAFLNIVTEWLSDIKMGYCTTAFYLNENFCCWGEDNGTAYPSKESCESILVLTCCRLSSVAQMDWLCAFQLLYLHGVRRMLFDSFHIKYALLMINRPCSHLSLLLWYDHSRHTRLAQAFRKSSASLQASS